MPPLLVSIVASACLGALVGLIRQWNDQTARADVDFGGVRTYSFWAMLGCVGAFASDQTSPLVLGVLFAAVGAQQITAKLSTSNGAHPGGTTFASTLLTLLAGCLEYWEERSAAVLVAATTMVLLGSKQSLHAWTRAFTRDDVRAALQFAAITGVILPLVPNRDLGPYGGFNPFSTWIMVVLISGLSLAGYIAMRTLGPGAGIMATSVFGGLASSTASTLAFARRSRTEPELSRTYALAVVVACTVMLPRVIVATAVINRDFALTLVVPFLVLAAPGVLYALGAWWLGSRQTPKENLAQLKNPLDLKTALKFAALYALVAFLVKAAPQLGFAQSLLPLSFLSGLTDMIAISLSIARHGVGEGNPATLATSAVVLAAISNTLLKAVLAVSLGSPGLRLRVALVLGATAAAGGGWLLWSA